MRKNWSKNDSCLVKIVAEVGLSDWTSVSQQLQSKSAETGRSGKQCRERWYNHLDPQVNKAAWSYGESLLLFESHRELGNRWKEISLRLKGRQICSHILRTDNNIKNHFYSTLRRSLRRLNKVAGEKNSTHQMREIKPSVLTIILKFIYDNQEENENNKGMLIEELKDLPKLIFEFAEFKPVKGNMHAAMKDANQKKIETIFRLVEQFKECYLSERNGEGKFEVMEDEEEKASSELGWPITHSEFKPQAKAVNVLINARKDPESMPNTTKQQSNSKETAIELDFQRSNQQNPLQIHRIPSPMTISCELSCNSDVLMIKKLECPLHEQIRMKVMANQNE